MGSVVGVVWVVLFRVNCYLSFYLGRQPRIYIYKHIYTYLYIHIYSIRTLCCPVYSASNFSSLIDLLPHNRTHLLLAKDFPPFLCIIILVFAGLRYTHVHTYIYIYIYTYIYTHIYTSVYRCMCTHCCICTYVWHVVTCMSASVYIHLYT